MPIIAQIIAGVTTGGGGGGGSTGGGGGGGGAFSVVKLATGLKALAAGSTALTAQK